MGFFSWRTADTNESIWNKHQTHSPVRTVYMILPNGHPPIEEKAYDGYGMFGNYDAYALFGFMNKHNGLVSPSSVVNKEEYRDYGINISYGEDKVKFPLKFSFNPAAKYEDLPASKDCPGQGYWNWEEAE